MPELFEIHRVLYGPAMASEFALRARRRIFDYWRRAVFASILIDLPRGKNPRTRRSLG
jgi:hypothetical protein